MKMHNPPHPGEILRELCLNPLGLTVTQAASALGISRKTLSGILNGRAGISAEMAMRLSIAFNTSAESWLLQQLQYLPPGKAVMAKVPVNLPDQGQVFGCVHGPAQQGEIGVMSHRMQAELVRVAINIGRHVFPPGRVGIVASKSSTAPTGA
jgi:addiction module HigA family antidote